MSLSFPISASTGDLYQTGSLPEYIYNDGAWTLLDVRATRVPRVVKAGRVDYTLSSSYAATSSFAHSSSYSQNVDYVSTCDYAATASISTKADRIVKHVEYINDTSGVDTFSSTIDGVFQIGLVQSTYKYALKNVSGETLVITKRGSIHDTTNATPTFNIDSASTSVSASNNSTTTLSQFTPTSLTGGVKEESAVSFTYNNKQRSYYIKAYCDSSSPGFYRSMIVVERLQ